MKKENEDFYILGNLYMDGACFHGIIRERLVRHMTAKNRSNELPVFVRLL